MGGSDKIGGFTGFNEFLKYNNVIFDLAKHRIELKENGSAKCKWTVSFQDIDTKPFNHASCQCSMSDYAKEDAESEHIEEISLARIKTYSDIKLQVQTSIDGYRVIAKYNGISTF